MPGPLGKSFVIYLGHKRLTQYKYKNEKGHFLKQHGQLLKCLKIVFIYPGAVLYYPVYMNERSSKESLLFFFNINDKNKSLENSRYAGNQK
jgi:hypothetical protein